MRFITVLFLFFFSISTFAEKYSYIDAHVHLVDFFQESEGVDELISQMDKANVEQSIVMGVPVVKKWHEDEPQKPRYYAGDDAALYWYSATDFIIYDLLTQAKEEQQKRLIPFLTGFNPNDKNSATYIKRLLDLHPGFWQGIGEVFTRHDDITALTLDEAPRANNEAMMAIYKVAGEYDLPVLIHSNITSKREAHPLYLEEILEALSKNPDVNFIWAHAGTSKEIHRHQGSLDFLYKELKEALEKHENLYVDLSWTMLDDYLLDKKDKVNKQWLNLIKTYPDRFVLGTDVLGKFSSQKKIIQGFDVFLDALPKKIAKQISVENIKKLLPEKNNLF